jgi:hypothetical protein
LEKLSLGTWASRRRKDLLELLDRMNPSIEELTAVVEQEAKKWPEVLRLMTHPGVGPLTALAFVLIIGTPQTSMLQCALRFSLMELMRAPFLCLDDEDTPAFQTAPKIHNFSRIFCRGT